MPTTSAENSGSGAVAQNGGVAAGAGGVAVKGNVYGDIHNYGNQPAQPIIPRHLPSLEPCFWLNDRLHPGKVAAVCGPGGMGKSALAAQAVHQLEAARFPDGIVFHSFYHQPKVETAQQAICTAFQVEAKAGLEAAVRTALSGRKALLILDGTEQADDLPALLRLRGTCGVLITSRKRTDALADRLDLKPLDEQPAAEVFWLYSGVAADDAGVQGICKLLGGWPVALRIAGRYLSTTGESAATYLKWLAKEPFRKLGKEAHRQENAALLLRRSVAQISTDAVQVLRLVGILAFASISLEPVMVVLSKEDEDQDDLELRSTEALGELVNYGLLETREERWQISHALIHTYARTELAMSTERLELLAWYYIRFCYEQSQAGIEGYVILDGERAHCLRLMQSCLASKLWEEVKLLVRAIDIYLDRQGYWADRLTAIGMNLTAAQQTGDRRDEARCLNSLGYTCWKHGEHEKSLTYLEQSLPICRELGDKNKEGILLNNMAGTYQQQDKHELALEYYQQSLSIARENGKRKGEGMTLNNIGQLYNAHGDHAQALQYYEQCLPIRREVGDKQGEGVTLNNIAERYRAQSNPAKALEYHEQALVILRQLGDRDGEAVVRWNIGLTYEDLGDLAAAEEHIILAVQIAEQIGHPKLETCCEGLARVRAARRA